MLTIGWGLGGLLVAVLIAGMLIRFSPPAHGQPPCAVSPLLSGPLRPALKSAIERLADATFLDSTQATDRLRGPAGRGAIAEPAPFPASTYVVRFGPREAPFAVVANAEIGLPHYSLVQPGVTAVAGRVHLAGAPEAPPSEPLSRPELDYLLHILYARLCAAPPAAEADALNRLKDVVLAIRFGAEPGLGAFHRSLASRFADGRGGR